jgi:hypothetical protein
MAKAKALSENEVSSILASELKNSYGYFDTGLVDDRKKANEYYFGESFGNEVEGRSQVVSTDVADTIEAILPALLRIFTASDNIVKVDPVTQEDTEIAKQASDYLNHIFNKDNDGFTTLYAMFKDALLHKNGIVKVFWDTSERTKQETYEKLSEAEFTMLIDEDGVEVKEHTEYADPAFEEQKKNIKEQMNQVGDQMSVDLMEQQIKELPIPQLHDVVITRSETFGRVKFEAVPPEEFLVQRRAKTLEEAHFLCHRTTKTRSELIEMGFDYDIVHSLSAESTQRYNEEKSTRHRNIDDDFTSDVGDSSTDEIPICESYIRIDEDGDGIAELRKIISSGDDSHTILDDVIVDSQPFCSVTPIIVPHRFYGRSVSELVEDIQLIKSTVMRQILDNMYLTNNNRVAVMDGQVNLEDLLTNRPGGVVRTKAAPSQVMMPMTTQTINNQAFPLLEYLDTVKENRSGITKYNQGMDTDSLNKTASGINTILSQSQMRIELIARIFAETGVKELFKKMFELVVKYQDKERIIKIRNNFIPMNPMEWRDRCNVTIQVGLGTGSRDQQLSILNQILRQQIEGIKLQGSPAGPIVNMNNIYNTLSKIVENAGLKDVDAYFTDPQVGMQNMPPPQQKEPSEFEKVSQIQTQQKAAEAQMQYENRMREIELRYQKMMLDFEAKVKELEMKYEADIDEKAIKREAMKMKGISDSNKQMLDQATKSLLQPQQPQGMSVEIDVESTEGTNKGPKG